MYRYGLPLAYKAFGVPHGEIRIRPLPVGAMSWEWSVSLPDYVKKLNENNIELGYANLFSLYKCTTGLEKDGITEITQKIRNIWPIYLWKKS